ncbi:hypothetical protein COOONC_07481 [Cooperia oncophora]
MFHVGDSGVKPDEPYEFFILSSYFYRTSKSLGNNSVALVFTGDLRAPRHFRRILLVGWNNETNVVVNATIERITPHNVCRWISIFSTSIMLPNMERLAISAGNKLVEIPFREPSVKKHSVVTCIAPLFGNEQWQQALFAAHIYKKFGTYMHLYVRSMVSPVYQLLRIYEEEGYLSIQPWLRVTLLTIDDRDFNPNINIEFRNQAAAQTDCLLQKPLSYIAFMDLDDVLIPRMARNYLDEFAHLFHSMPNVAYIHYMKENTRLDVVTRNSGSFSLRAMLSTIHFEHVSETGKMVADPLQVNHTWIHYPKKIARGKDSLGNNSVALVFTGDLRAPRHFRRILLVGWNNETNVVVNATIERITPHNVCRWISIFSTSIMLPNMERLAISAGNKLVEIPFREPSVKKHSVVTCIAPLFGNEQWQQALFAAHIYKK